MNKNFWFTLIAILVMASMILTACGGGAATEAPAEEEQSMEEAPAEEQPAEEAPAEEPAEEAPAEEEKTDVTDTSGAMEDVYADIDPTGQVVTFWHQHSREREGHPQRPGSDLSHPLAADPQVEGEVKDDDDQHGKDKHCAEHLFGPELRDDVLPDDGPDLLQVAHCLLITKPAGISSPTVLASGSTIPLSPARHIPVDFLHPHQI